MDSLLEQSLNYLTLILCVVVVTASLPRPSRAGCALFGGSQGFAFVTGFEGEGGTCGVLWGPTGGMGSYGVL